MIEFIVKTFPNLKPETLKTLTKKCIIAEILNPLIERFHDDIDFLNQIIENHSIYSPTKCLEKILTYPLPKASILTLITKLNHYINYRGQATGECQRLSDLITQQEHADDEIFSKIFEKIHIDDISLATLQRIVEKTTDKKQPWYLDALKKVQQEFKNRWPQEKSNPNDGADQKPDF